MTRVRTVESLQAENDALRAQVEQLSKLVQVSYRDPLTELRNQRYFEQRLIEEVDRRHRNPRSSMSLLVLSVDNLQSINDEMGRATGDFVLKRVARFLEDCLRQQDVCCRTGGDEFGVILPDTNARATELLLVRLHEEIASFFSTWEFPVVLSIGHAAMVDQDTAATFLDRAVASSRRE